MKRVFIIMKNWFELMENKQYCPVTITSNFNNTEHNSIKSNIIYRYVDPQKFIDSEDVQLKERDNNSFKINPSPKFGNEKRVFAHTHSKKRFLIKLGNQYNSVKSKSVAWFKYEDGVTLAFTFDNNRFFINYPIEQLSGFLESERFFQINRRFIINYNCIRNIHSWFNSRLKLEIAPKPDENIIVSRERVKDFKLWLDM